MEPITFYMDQEGCKEYFKALQATPGTRCHSALKSNRLMMVLMVVIMTLVMQLMSKPSAAAFAISALLVAVITIVMCVFYLPWAQIHGQVTQFKAQGKGDESFRQTHRIWADEQFYYHQIGDTEAKGRPLAGLKHVQEASRGGVVLRFVETDDYIPASAFGETMSVQEFCTQLQALAAGASNAAVTAQQLPAAGADGETPAAAQPAEPQAQELLHLSFQNSQEETIDLLCEAISKIKRSKVYWSSHWQFLILLPLIFVIWTTMGAPIILLLVLIALAVLMMYSPALSHKKRERELKLGRLDRFLGAQEMSFTPERMFTLNDTGRTSFQYKYVPYVMEGELGVYLVGKNGKGCLPIPKSAFEDEAAVRAFVEMYGKLVRGEVQK